MTRSLSVVVPGSPRMYRFVLDSCSEPMVELLLDEFVLAMLLLIWLLEMVPFWLLWDPVLLEFDFDGLLAVGTRLSYWKTEKNDIGKRKKYFFHKYFNNINCWNYFSQSPVLEMTAPMPSSHSGVDVWMRWCTPLVFHNIRDFYG